MGIITECLMVLLLCQTICILADPMEQKDTPAGPQDSLMATYEEDNEEKFGAFKRFGCPDSLLGLPAFPWGGYKYCICRMNLEAMGNTMVCSNVKAPEEKSRRSPEEQEMNNDGLEFLNQNVEEFDAMLGLETEEELAAQAFAAEIEKRGSCSKPKVVKDRTVKQLNQDYVKWHNYYRCLHGVGPVKYDTTLEATARRNVEMNVRGGGMVHTKNSRYGENLWAMWGGGFGIAAISGQNPVKSWYDEMKSPGYSFNRRNPTMFSYGTGHFTQVVWAATKKIGCWTAEHPYQGMTRVFVACNYDPAGNMNIRPKDKNVANWNKNVPPPI